MHLFYPRYHAQSFYRNTFLVNRPQEIARAEKDSGHQLKLATSKVVLPAVKRRGPRYTPVSKRQDRPNAILWLVRNHPELKDAQISRLVGTTKTTLQAIRERTHWNSSQLAPMDPVTLGLCSQIDLDMEVEKASKGRPLPTAAELGATLQAASETEHLGFSYEREEEKEIDVNAVFSKLKSLKSDRQDDEDDDRF